MDFEWDARKEATNIKKHGLNFSEAASIFQGSHFTREDARLEYGETRLVTVGVIGSHVIVVVVLTSRKEVTRIVSARHANPKERSQYYVYCSKKR